MSKRILIVEDELVIAENTKILIEESYSDIEIEIAGDVEEALQLMKSFSPEIALLDIRLGKGQDGVDLSHQLELKKIPFLFVTSHGDPSTVSRALKSKPLGYLIKPINQKDLYVNLEMAFNQLEDENVFIFKDGSHDVRLPEKEIVYLCADGNYTEIHTTKKRYILRNSMKNVIEKIQTPLLQTHRSYFVNPDFIRETNEEVHLTNSNKIPLSRSYKKQVLKELFNK